MKSSPHGFRKTFTRSTNPATRADSHGGRDWRQSHYYHQCRNLIPKTMNEGVKRSMKPLIPSVGTSLAEDNQVSLNDLKEDARDLLRSAKQRMDMDGMGTILEKVAGGSGRTKTSSDLEGIAALITATQGGANETMMGANSLLMGLLNRKDSGNTQGSSIDEIIKLVVLMKALKEDQPRQDNTQIALIMDHMTKMMEQMGLRFTDYVEMNKNHYEYVINDLQNKAAPDPITSQIYSQVLPTIVEQAIGQSRKNPLDQLAELKESLDKLGGLHLFGNGNSEYTPERLQYEGMQLKKAQMFSDERKHMATIDAGHKKWKEIGDVAAQIFGGNEGGGPGLSFAGMMQGLAGAGQPNGQGAGQ